VDRVSLAKGLLTGATNVSCEECNGGSSKLGKGAVDGSNQRELCGWMSEGATESSKSNKGKKSTQITGGNNTVGDAVAQPAGDQDTVDDVDNTVRGAMLRATTVFPLILVGKRVTAKLSPLRASRNLP
jgi:hypothetical protein